MKHAYTIPGARIRPRGPDEAPYDPNEHEWDDDEELEPESEPENEPAEIPA